MAINDQPIQRPPAWGQGAAVDLHAARSRIEQASGVLRSAVIAADESGEGDTPEWAAVAGAAELLALALAALDPAEVRAAA